MGALTYAIACSQCKNRGKDAEKCRKCRCEIESGFEVDPLNGWIPVTERLPDAHRTYLCRYGFNTFPDYLMTGCLDWIMFDKHPHWQHETTGLFVTHWMPLPEAPKEVE